MKDSRDVALEVLRRVSTGGAFAGAALRAAFSATELDDKDRSLATELVYGVLRHRAQLDRAISNFGKRLKDLDPKLHDVLRLAAYQLIFLDRIPDHAAVNSAVEQAKARRGKRGAGQTNAILRKLSNQPRAERMPTWASATEDPIRHVAETASLPRWMAEKLLSQYGLDKAVAFGRASLERPHASLRANLLKTTRDALIEEIGGTAGMHPRAVRLPPRQAELPAALPCISEGRATLQDEASMRVVDLLDPQPGESILDLCAAPGGKSGDIAERMRDEGRVVCHDRLPEKIQALEDTKRRLGSKALETAEVVPDETFDRVLVDAPCSGSGTLRRHPEIRWRTRADDVERLTLLQSQVLATGARHVRPGGTLVYSVCSVLEEEGAALFPNPTVTLDGIEFDVERTFSIGPDEEGAPDGFFAARLVRRPE